MSSVLEALVSIQQQLKAPKDQKAGRYNYRNIEDINEAVKPLAAAHGCAVIYTDTFTDSGACVSTCRLIGEDGQICADGVAYVNRNPAHMSIEQASGAASSYARKYAACGLFAIDSSENDPDRTNAKPVNDPLKDAQRALWAACKAYAERHGRDAKDISDGVKKRPEYAEQQSSAEWLLAVADELNND